MDANIALGSKVLIQAFLHGFRLQRDPRFCHALAEAENLLAIRHRTALLERLLLSVAHAILDHGNAFQLIRGIDSNTGFPILLRISHESKANEFELVLELRAKLLEVSTGVPGKTDILLHAHKLLGAGRIIVEAYLLEIRRRVLNGGTGGEQKQTAKQNLLHGESLKIWG